MKYIREPEPITPLLTAHEAGILFGKRARVHRLRRSLSVTALSKKIGVSSHKITCLEKDGKASLDTVFKLSLFFDQLRGIKDLFYYCPFDTMDEVISYYSELEKEPKRVTYYDSILLNNMVNRSKK